MTTGEFPREKNMDLKSVQVNVIKVVKRMKKRGVDIQPEDALSVKLY